MTIFDLIIKARVELVQKPQPTTPTPNNPPVWDQQPSAVATQGTASNHSYDLASDADADPITYSLNTGTVALPSGWTNNSSLKRLEYDGAGPAVSSSGHILTASDGTDTTDSIAFNIITQEDVALTGPGQPYIAVFNIGGRTESDVWRDPAFRERCAVADWLVVNYAPGDNSHIAEDVAAIKAHNPNLRVVQYKDPSAFLVSSPLQQEDQAVVENNFVTPALPGGTATDGMARTVDGTVILQGWPNKNDVNPTDFPNTFNGQLPYVFAGTQRYDESFTGSIATVFDAMYCDVWIYYGRISDHKGDYNRDGVRYDKNLDGAAAYENFSPSGTINSSMIRTKVALYDAIQTKALSDRGENLPIVGNIGSWGDWFDAGQAQNDVITESPTDLAAVTTGGTVESWGKIHGFNPDGSAKTGSFQRAYKQAYRILSYLGTFSDTGTKPLWTHVELLSTLYDTAAYLMGCSTLVGSHFVWSAGANHKDPQELDEFFGQDRSGMTTAQKVAAMHWMGYPIGGNPAYGDSYIANTNGGIIQNGIYGLHFTSDGTSGGTDQAFLLVNPTENGSQNFDTSLLPFPCKFINGGQRAINDGSNLSGTIVIPASTSYFLVPQ